MTCKEIFISNNFADERKYSTVTYSGEKFAKQRNLIRNSSGQMLMFIEISLP